ncbi:MAG: hypothetical protein CMN58_01180 [Solibacterales bacterium]|nr:hypothetical protein [Bryobacterales bacterium]|tara:strand:- start:1626 stop:2426 length:801 start_codon:yes stop_codon:yes gene_type:complete
MNPSLIKAIFVTFAFTNSSDAKIGTEQRAYIVRQMTAEYGTARVIIPRSKKALGVSASGRYDETEWNTAMGEFGPAARLGDLVQITKVKFKKKRLILVLNYGIKGGRKWWHRIQISGATHQRTSLGTSQRAHAPGGTKIALNFGNNTSTLDASKIKQMLTPLIDFTQRSATELYMEKLPEEFKEAIVSKRVIEGMNRKMVLLAMGRPDRKVRDFENGTETEDWIYGTPPGNLTFITFKDETVIKVRDTYAAPGGTVGIAQPPQDKQ